MVTSTRSGGTRPHTRAVEALIFSISNRVLGWSATQPHQPFKFGYDYLGLSEAGSIVLG